MSDPVLLAQDADLLSRVFRVKLSPGLPPPGIVTLPSLAAELAAEQASTIATAAAAGQDPRAAAERRWEEMGQRRSLIDRTVMNLLSEPPDGSTGVFDRLARHYGRAQDEKRRLLSLKSGGPPAGTLELVEYSLELCCSYSAMALCNPMLFPQPDAIVAMGSARLLVLVEHDLSGTQPLPAGLLVRLVEHAHAEGSLDELAQPLWSALHARMRAESLLTNFSLPLRVLVALLEAKPLRLALVNDARFLPQGPAPIPRLPPQYAHLQGQSALPPGAPNGRAFELSLLGPFLSPSGFPPESVSQILTAAQLTMGGTDTPASLFAGASKQTRSQVEANLSVLRTGARTVVGGMKTALELLLKSKEAQPRLFAWVGGALSANSERAKDYYAYNRPTSDALASPGLVYNLTWALLKLCGPFADPACPIAAKLDGSFLLSTHRFETSAETKLNATGDALMHWLDPRNEDARQRYLRHMEQERQQQITEQQQQATAAGTSTGARADGTALAEGATTAAGPESSEDTLAISSSFGTVSEFFFCALRGLHASAMPAYKRLDNHEQTERRTYVEAARLRASGDDAKALAKLDAELDEMSAKRYCLEAHLFDPEFTADALRVYLLCMAWLLRLVAESQSRGAPPVLRRPDGAEAAPGAKDALPLPQLPLGAHVPKIFAAQPEHVMDDAICMVKWLGRSEPEALEALQEPQLQLLLSFCVTFLGAKRYVHDPYLRARITEVLALFVPRKEPQGSHRGSAMGGGGLPTKMSNVLAGHTLARKWLAPYLLVFFVDIEFSGSHSGFYDKFTYRHHMAVLLEHIWTVPEYRQSVIETDDAIIVRFLNFILNDSVYCMDEAMLKLVKIRYLERLQADVPKWSEMAADERTDRLAELRGAQDYAGYYMQLANEIVHMLVYLTSEPRLVPLFTRPELVLRLAAMLNHFVVRLVGPQCTELKVLTPDKYHFNPRELLREISLVYIHLAPQPEFAPAVVADQRSYREAYFRKAQGRVLQHMLSEDLLAKFAGFAAKCAKLSEAESQMEEDLGEIPDEYLCAITAELMSEPVLLPSGVHVGKEHILRHLLSDPTDPFNRAHLKPEMLQPAPELQAEIAAWKKARLAQAARDKAGGAEAMVVDG